MHVSEAKYASHWCTFSQEPCLWKTIDMDKITDASLQLDSRNFPSCMAMKKVAEPLLVEKPIVLLSILLGIGYHIVSLLEHKIQGCHVKASRKSLVLHGYMDKCPWISWLFIDIIHRRNLHFVQ